MNTKEIIDFITEDFYQHLINYSNNIILFFGLKDNNYYKLTIDDSFPDLPDNFLYSFKFPTPLDNLYLMSSVLNNKDYLKFKNGKIISDKQYKIISIQIKNGTKKEISNQITKYLILL